MAKPRKSDLHLATVYNPGEITPEELHVFAARGAKIHTDKEGRVTVTRFVSPEEAAKQFRLEGA